MFLSTLQESSDNSLLIYHIDEYKIHKIMEVIINQILHCFSTSKMKRDIESIMRKKTSLQK